MLDYETSGVFLDDLSSDYLRYYRRALTSLKCIGMTVASIGVLVPLAMVLVIHFQEYLFLPSLMASELDYLPPGFAEESILTKDGEHIALWHYDVAPESKRGAVLLLHGNGDLLTDTDSLAPIFNAMGFSTYEIDYRGTGKSSGWPTEAGLHNDADAAWRYAVNREGGASRLHLVGFSFGTGLATYLAQRYDPPSLVLIAPYLSIPDVLADRDNAFFLRYFARINLPTRDLIPHMGRTRILAIHGMDDTVILPHHSEDLADLYRGTGTFSRLLVQDADHDDIVQHSRAAMREWMLEGTITKVPEGSSLFEETDCGIP